MGYVTANGADAFDSHIRIPRVGVWHADLMLPESAASGLGAGARVTLRVADSLSFVGAVRYSGVSRGALFAKIVGGAGGIPTMLPAKSYRSVLLSLPLTEALATGNEVLSPTISTDLLSRFLPQWTRIQQTAAHEVMSLVAAAGAGLSWRILPDGTFWFGVERWPATGMLGWHLLQDEPTRKTAIVSADVPAILPGETIAGRRVSYVEHHFTERRLRTELWFE